MSLLIELTVRESHRDAASGRLFDEGALGVEETESGLKGYFGDPTRSDALRAALELYLDNLDEQEEQREHWAVSCSTIEDKDWNEAWKANWKEQFFGESISVCPSWLKPAESGRTVLHLDPGSAFGTGSHESTALMLEALDRMDDLEGKAVLDAGCGSGILSMAAVKLGADFAYGIDIEVEAIDSSRENARKNGCHIKTHFVQGTPRDLGEKYRFDLVLANIQRSVIELFFHDLLRAARDGATILVAGILKEEEDTMVKLAAEYKLPAPEVTRKNNWISLRYQRPEGHQI